MLLTRASTGGENYSMSVLIHIYTGQEGWRGRRRARGGRREGKRIKMERERERERERRRDRERGRERKRIKIERERERERENKMDSQADEENPLRRRGSDRVR